MSTGVLASGFSACSSRGLEVVVGGASVEGDGSTIDLKETKPQEDIWLNISKLIIINL